MLSMLLNMFDKKNISLNGKEQICDYDENPMKTVILDFLQA